MKAAVFVRAGVLAVEEVPLRRPGRGEVLVKVACCAICGSDLHRYQHGLLAPGVIMGHEYAGTVAEVGEGVTRWQVGDRVIKAIPMDRPLILPRTYNARTRGLTQDLNTPGGYADYVVVAEDSLLATPPGISDEVAALAEPLAVAVHTVRLSGLRLGDAVAVFGAGPVGLFVLQCAGQCAPQPMVVVEPAAVRRDLALRLGADTVLDPRAADPVAAIVDLTGGEGASVVFECAGARPTLQQALDATKPRGATVVVALCMESCAVSPADWLARELRLQACYGFQPEDWRIALNLLGSGRVAAEPLISQRVPLAGIQEAFQSLLTPTDQLQVLVVPEG